MVKRNDKYQEHKILFSSRNKERYKEFLIEGKFNVTGLEILRMQGAVDRIFPPSDEEIEEEQPKEMLIYKTSLEKITMIVNYETHLHSVHVAFKYDYKKDTEKYEKLKQILETNLGCTLEDPEESKKENSNLISKLKSN